MSNVKELVRFFIQQNNCHCLVIIEDFLTIFLNELCSILSKSKIHFLHEKFIVSILEDVNATWNVRLEKLFVLELHQAKAENLLQGLTAEERHHYFLNAMFDVDNQIIFLDRYPSLRKCLFEYKQLYIFNFSELFERFCADAGEIAEIFFLNYTECHLISYKSLGDYHKKQHTVSVLTFITNDHKTSIIYKPREVKNDILFSQIINWLNSKSDISLKNIKWLDKFNYGWCEYLEKMTCTNEIQPKTFYYRFGMLAALAYVFDIHDLHYENLLSCADQPVLIDLECFGQEIINFVLPQNHFQHVLKSGLLPQYLIERNAATDISAFSGGGEECEIPFENSYIENSGKDETHFSRKSGYFTLQDNRCTLLNQPVVPYSYKDNVIEGFIFAYKTILAYRQEILMKFEQRLDDIHTRIVLRPTAVYAKLIYESYHPTLLRDDKALKNHFDWLLTHPILINNDNEVSQALYLSEIEQISHGDVPLFFVKGACLYDSYANKLPLKLISSPKDLILRKINSLSEDDLAIQKMLISKSIDTYQVNYGNNYLTYQKDKQEKNHINGNIVQLIEKYLSYLLSNCANKAEFIFPTFKQILIEQNNKEYWMLSFGLPELYSGTIGIILVLIYSYMLLKNSDYLDWALLGLNALKCQLNEIDEKDDVDCSLYNGIGGWLYLSIKSREVISCFNFDLFVDDILNLIIIKLDKWLEKYEFDVISGISGLLLVLNLYVKDDYFTEKAKNIIYVCQEFLLSKYPHPDELPEKAWNTHTKIPVLGFSHGLSGILYALHITCDSKHNSKISSWIQQALAYERSKYNYEFQGWANTFSLQKNKEDIAKNLYQNDWCHGSLGIGISRIELKKMGWIDPVIDYEISISILTLSNPDEQLPLNLCHGLLGKIDYCLYLHENNLIDEKRLNLLKASLINQLKNNKPEDLVTELRKEIFIPGIMTGFSGIIYTLLRLIDPKKVPFLLSLE